MVFLAADKETTHEYEKKTVTLTKSTTTINHSLDHLVKIRT